MKFYGRGLHRLQIPWLYCIEIDIPQIFPFQEGLFIADDILMVNWSQDSDLVQGIFCFFVWEIS